LFLLRIRFLQVWSGGRPGKVALLYQKRLLCGRHSSHPHPMPGRVSAVSGPGPYWRPLEWSSVQDAGGPKTGRVLLGRPGNGPCLRLLTLSCCPPSLCCGPRHSGGCEAGTTFSGHILDLEGPLIKAWGLGSCIWFPIPQHLGRRPLSMNSASAPPWFSNVQISGGVSPHPID